MIVYIILAFLVFVLNYLKQVYWFVKPALTNKSVDNIKNGINEGKESSFTAIFILVLISGFRAYSVGLDLGNYLANFNAIANNLTIKTGHGFEILFQSLNYWCALIFGNQVGFTVLLFIISIIFAYSINQVIQKNSASFALSFFLIITLGIYAQSFSALRQILALSVVLLSIKYIQQRNLFMFIFYIIIAIFFHKTAFIFFPVYFLYNVKFNWKYMLSLSILSLLLIIFFPQITQILSFILHKDYYNQYVTSGVFTGRAKLFEVLWTVSMCIIFAIFYFWKLYKNKHGNAISKNTEFFLYLYFLNCIIRVVGIFVNMPALFGRFSMYFFFSLCIIIPEFLNSIKNSKLKYLCYTLVILVAFVYMFVLIGYKNSCGVNIYEFVKF